MVVTSHKMSHVCSERLKAKNETKSYQMNTFRAAIFLRKNSANQKLGYSSQIEACRKYIEHNGWIAGDLFLEKNKTGTTKGTPIFRLMIQRAKSRCFDAIVVYSQDRLSRSRSELDNLRKTLFECNVEICCVSKNIEVSSDLQTNAYDVSD